MSLRVKEITEPVYGANYVLLFGTRAELETWGTTGEAGSLVEIAAEGMLKDSEHIRGRYLTISHVDGCMYYVLFVRSDLDAMALATVPAHETFHAVTTVLLDKGLRLSADSEEAFAYLQTYLLEHYYTLMASPKQKRRTRRRSGK